jgi:hypothetical protein
MRVLPALFIGCLILANGGCAVTNMTARALAVGAPTRLDPGQPAVAVSEIVGVSAQHLLDEWVLHLSARLEDGTTVHLGASQVDRPDPRTDPGPDRIHFARVEGPLPPSDLPLAVTASFERPSDGARVTTWARYLHVGGESRQHRIHRVREDGTIDPEAEVLTSGMAARWGLVELHLDRSSTIRRALWNVVLYAPPAGGRQLASVTTEDSDGNSSTIEGQVVLSIPSSVTDDTLFGPVPPASSFGKSILFTLAAPFTLTADAALWLSVVGIPVEIWLLEREGDDVQAPREARQHRPER